MSEQQVLSQLEIVKNNQHELEQHQLDIIARLKSIDSGLRFIKAQLTQGHTQNVHHKLDAIIRHTR